MIKIDAANFIPKRLGTYLLGVIPGCFFELTIAFSSPTVAHQYIERVHQVYPVNGYTLIFIFAVSALIVGQTFFFAAWLVDLVLDSAYRLLRYTILHFTFGSEWLYKAMSKWQFKSKKPISRLVWKPIMWARERRFAFRARPAIVCQRITALQLLRDKYGINPSKKTPSTLADECWQVWTAVLGKTPTGLKDSLLLMRVSIACGLAELASLYCRIELRNRYFVVMCGMLLVAGLIQQFFISRDRNNPVRSSTTRLLLLLEELSQFRLGNNSKDEVANKDLSIEMASDSDEQQKGK